MLSKNELYKKIRRRFKEKKLSVDFWFSNFYEFYKKEKMTEKVIFRLLADVNKNQT